MSQADLGVVLDWEPCPACWGLAEQKNKHFQCSALARAACPHASSKATRQGAHRCRLTRARLALAPHL